MKNLSNMFVILITTIALFGCAQNQVDIRPKIIDSHILIENTNLNKWLELEKVNYFKRKDGLLVVEAKFKNTNSSNKNVAYKIDWIDKNGLTQKSILSRWIVSEVESNRSFIINGISPSITVSDFEIRLQEPTRDDKNRKNSYHLEYQN